jgi:hypothetical protein
MEWRRRGLETLGGPPIRNRFRDLGPGIRRDGRLGLVHFGRLEAVRNWLPFGFPRKGKGSDTSTLTAPEGR